MKTIILSFSFLFMLCADSTSQKIYLTDHPIYLDIIKQYIYVFSIPDSSIRTNYGDQSKEYIKILI